MATSTRRASWNLDSPRDVDWRDRVECGPDGQQRHGLGLDAWIVASKVLDEDNRSAARVCREVCPVRAECAALYDGLDPSDRLSVVAAGDYYDGRGRPHKITTRLRAAPPPSIAKPDGTLVKVVSAVLAATMAACTVEHVYDAIAAGRLLATTDPSGWLIRWDDLDDWMAARTVSDG